MVLGKWYRKWCWEKTAIELQPEELEDIKKVDLDVGSLGLSNTAYGPTAGTDGSHAAELYVYLALPSNGPHCCTRTRISARYLRLTSKRPTACATKIYVRRLDEMLLMLCDPGCL